MFSPNPTILLCSTCSQTKPKYVTFCRWFLTPVRSFLSPDVVSDYFFGVFLWLLSDERRATNDGVGRDAAADANEEHHGVRQHEEGVLHIHPQHHSGGC